MSAATRFWTNSYNFQCGHFLPYCKDIKAYSCPLKLKGNVDEPIFRTYGIVDSMNGYGADHFDSSGNRVRPMIRKKLDQIKKTGERIVFLCEGYSTFSSWSISEDDNDNWWGIGPIPSYSNEYAPSHHDKSGTFSYVDGHAGKHKWDDKRTLEWRYPSPGAYPYQPGNVDIRWMKRAVWGFTFDGRL